MRATSGIWISATPTTRTARLEPSPSPAPGGRSAGSESRTSAERIRIGSSSPRVSGGQTDGEAASVGEQHRQPGERDHAPPSPEDRESTSRPRKSVPSSASGSAPRTGSRSAVRASAGRRTARTARRAPRRRAQPRPPRPSRSARTEAPQPRPTAASARARRRQVGDDVHGDVDRRDHDRDRLHRAHVADRDRVDELLPDTRVVEQVLDDDDPADQVLDVLREDLHRRRERVAKRVPPDDGRSDRPLSRAIST